MNSKSKYLIKNTGLLTISNFASKILVFLLVPLYTSVLSTSEYGTYDLIVSTVSLLYPLFTLNITDAVMRFLMDKNCHKDDVASVGMKFVLGSICVFSVLIFIFSHTSIGQAVSDIVPYMELYYIFYVLNSYFIQLTKGLERVMDMGIAGVISTVVMLAANILFLLVFKLGLPGFLLANVLAQMIQALYLAVRLKFWTYMKWNTDTLLQKEMLIYCVPLIATALGWWVNNALDKYVVTFMCGVAANGILSVAYKIPQIINTLQGIFIQAWQISAIKEYGEDDTAVFYGKTFSVINMFMCVACSGLIFLSKPLASILYANDFYIAWSYVPFLLISSVLNCASGFLGPILSAQKKSKEMAMSAVYGASANMVLNIVLVYFMGIQGATVATVISSFVIYVVRKRSVGKDIEIKNYYLVLSTWGILCLQAVFEIYTSFWYVEIILMIFILYINKEYMRRIVHILQNVMNRKRIK